MTARLEDSFEVEDILGGLDYKAVDQAGMPMARMLG
jgi:hypothetical protein